MMEKQMSLFRKGGLEDEGGEIDEVSGNKVPVGGTKKGVRDDIPAMVSEGEFVFPEDVTRYIGLETLMQMRQEAKMGLKKMEAMGQMGNSDEATIPDDLPFTAADLIIVSGEKPENDDKTKKLNRGGVVHANQGMLAQNQNPNQFMPTTGIIGMQPSIYSQPNTQPFNPNPVVPQPTFQPPAITTGGETAQPTGPAFFGTIPEPVKPVKFKDFVTEADDVYKTIKFINPETGEIRDVRTYNGEPVNPLPAGFIPYDDYMASGEQPVTGTEVETTQTIQEPRDDDSYDQQVLTRMREDKQRQDSTKFRNMLDPTKEEFKNASKDDLVNAYLDNKKGQTVATGMSIIPGVGIVGLAGRFAAKNQENKIAAALTAKFGNESWKEDERIKGYEESGLLGDTFAGLKDIGSDIKEGLAETFTKGGRQGFYDRYQAQYDVKDVGNSQGSSYSKDPVTKVKSGHLNVREQQSFDNAVRDGNASVANHHALIASHRARQDSFADTNRDLITRAQNGDKAAEQELYAKKPFGMSNATVEQTIKYGSSVHTAVNKGTAVYNKNPLKAARVTTDSEPAGSNDSDKTSDSCVIATHALQSGAFKNSDRANAVDWCKRTLHDKWWGETMRRGYRYLGRKHIANGTADTVYKEFKECIEWANGKRPFTIKVASRYYYRAVQTFIVGLFIKEEV